MNANHMARWETLLKNIQSAPVITVTKDRNNNGFVPDVKVRVACGKPCVPIADVSGHR
jgi:hypothetical protein